MDIENIYVNGLPLEMIVKIISYLPASDRKRARLVCKRWYEASKDVSITKYQTCSFHGLKYDNQINLMFDTLKKGHFNPYNFSFTETILDDQFESFLESHGAVIHSLSFDSCQFSFKTLEKMMINCINLKKLFFLRCYCHSDTGSLIPMLNGVEIVRKNMKTLEFHYCNWMSDLLLTIFLSVYSSVKEITLHQVNMNFDYRIFNRYYRNRDNYKPSDCVLTYKHFYRCTAHLCQEIEKLNLGNPLGDGFTDDELTTLASTSYFRLKAISVTNHRAITSTGFKNFLIHQTNLIDVNFAGCSNFNFECFQFLFHQNRNLENIEIDFNNNLTISESLVKSLALSPLKSLRFKIPTEIIYLQPTNSYENDQLLKLDLNLIISESNGNVFLLPMLKPFRNLTSLSIDFSNQRPNNIQDGRQTASYIFENLTNLRELKLYCLKDWINDETFDNCSECFKSALKHLDLTHPIRKSAIQKFNFPNLKSLRLKCTELDECDIIHLSETSTRLEFLDISHTSVPMASLLEMCRRLKFLRELYVAQPDNLDEFNYPDDVLPDIHFKCPSLRYLQITSVGYSDYDYYRKSWRTWCGILGCTIDTASRTS